jgi:hypothetical protein
MLPRYESWNNGKILPPRRQRNFKNEVWIRECLLSVEKSHQRSLIPLVRSFLRYLIICNAIPLKNRKSDSTCWCQSRYVPTLFELYLFLLHNYSFFLHACLFLFWQDSAVNLWSSAMLLWYQHLGFWNYIIEDWPEEPMAILILYTYHLSRFDFSSFLVLSH